MSETAEGVGGRKWSLEKKISGDTHHEETFLMEGKNNIAMLWPLGKQLSHLLVTAPQLWAAANELLKIAAKVEKSSNPAWAAAEDQLGKMVAKAVGKDDWSKVAQ